MTRDEITKITQAYVGSNTPPPRLGFNEKTAYFNCVKEVQMLVASCPSIINYVAYLNNVKAYQLTSTIDKQATKLVQSITNVERNIVEATELESNIAEFKRLLEQQRAHASSASLIYNEEHNWLLPFAEKLKFYIKRESEVNEALELLLTTLPKSLSGTRVILSDEGNITCGGSAATLSYNNVTVDSAPLITSDTSILGSLVKNSKTTAELVTPVTGTTKELTLSSTRFVSPIITNYTSSRSIVQDIASSNITLDTSSEEVQTCLLVFRVQNDNSSPASFTTVAFDPTTVSFYRKLSRICHKWKHPEILSSIHKYGFNFVFNSTNFESVPAKLKKSTQRVASYTDTRGLIR